LSGSFGLDSDQQNHAAHSYTVFRKMALLEFVNLTNKCFHERDTFSRRGHI
jgi:hypothetical protein